MCSSENGRAESDKSHRNVNNVIKVEILILLLCVIGCVAEFMENLMRV